MKTTSRCILLGLVVIGIGVTYRPTVLRAQSASESLEAGSDDRPWNQGVPVEIRQAARGLFLEGNRLFRIPLFAQAAEQYTAALGKWKHPAFYFNLALAQLNLGQDVEAHNNLEQAVGHGAEPLGAERFKEANDQLQKVERQLGRILVTCQTEGAEVTLDGVTLFTGAGSHQGWVKAKAHEITARKPDYLSEARRVTVAHGELQAVELRLITLNEAAERGRRWTVWKPWAVVVAGAVVAAGGGVLHALSSQDFHEYDARFSNLGCVTGPNAHGCARDEIPSELNDRLNRATREQQIAVGGYIAGGAVLATGIVLLYMNRPHLEEQPATSSPTAGVTVLPTVSGDALGILVSVSR